jgi:hypothetical protein
MTTQPFFQPFFLGEKFRQKGKKEKESDFRVSEK